MLSASYEKGKIEAGCDEAGRGCLAGPVFAAAVILKKDYQNPYLDDSKKLDFKDRYRLRETIKEDSLAWAVASATPAEIDEMNILKASYLAMHRAIDQLSVQPELLLIDGNRFEPFKNFDHVCIVKGDSKFLSIAAASILAKTYRDDFMMALHNRFPQYHWDKNKGYPTLQHKQAIMTHGLSPYHRRSFNHHIQLKFGF